jgi:hypothetical protein
MKIYGDLNSGNCLKVKWVCDRLALSYTWIPVDILKRESRTSQFLKLNGAGQVNSTMAARWRNPMPSFAISPATAT